MVFTKAKSGAIIFWTFYAVVLIKYGKRQRYIEKYHTCLLSPLEGVIKVDDHKTF